MRFMIKILLLVIPIMSILFFIANERYSSYDEEYQALRLVIFTFLSSYTYYYLKFNNREKPIIIFIIILYNPFLTLDAQYTDVYRLLNFSVMFILSGLLIYEVSKILEKQTKKGVQEEDKEEYMGIFSKWYTRDELLKIPEDTMYYSLIIEFCTRFPNAKKLFCLEENQSNYVLTITYEENGKNYKRVITSEGNYKDKEEEVDKN